MSNITLKSVAALLKEELEPINTKLDAVAETLSEHTKTLSRHTKIRSEHGDILSHHTGALEHLLTEKKTKTNNEAVPAHRVERLELCAQQVGQKLGIKL